MNYLYLLQLLAPEAIVLVAALAVLGLGLGPHRERRSLLLAVTLAGCVLAGLALAFFPQNASVLNGTAVLDPLTRLFKQVILLLSAITAVFARDSKVRANFAEYMALILFATIGMMLLAGTEELLTIFIALELTSLSLYVLTGFQTRDRASAEAALKYFLVGGISAGFLLFGLSLIYGVTGSTNLSEIARCLRGGGPMDPLLGAGMVMTLVGFGFKVAAVPFHLWAPDVYQGAPTSSAALVASGSKVAGFFVLSKVLVIALGPASGSAAWGAFRAGWAPLVALMAAFSIVLGNLAALAQNSVKRLLAYSAIAHAGYMLLALTVAGSAGVAPVLFYVIVYALTAVGAFGVVAAVEQCRGGANLDHFSGLHKSAPGLSLCMAVFLISMAGIPPLAGFFGKFYLFAGATASFSANAGMLWLVVLAVICNAISLYYYLIVLKHIFVAEEGLACVRDASRASGVLIALLAASIVILGLRPDWLLEPLRAAVLLARGLH